MVAEGIDSPAATARYPRAHELDYVPTDEPIIIGPYDEHVSIRDVAAHADDVVDVTHNR
jgi:hypothetical protein